MEWGNSDIDAAPMTVPRQGGFPSLLAIATIFFTGARWASLQAAAVLTLLILLSIAMTFLVSRILTATVLKGEASSFVLELPPYRRPQIGKVLVRSVFERTLVVLGRAVMTAAPVNLLIWVMANLRSGGVSLLMYAADLLSPLGWLIGLDGVLLLAFLLGLPANEIVLPVAVTVYTGAAQLTDYSSLGALQQILTANGWNIATAVCFLVFTLFHWPCATTLLTIRKETGSLRHTVFAFVLPMTVGIVLCACLHGLLSVFL